MDAHLVLAMEDLAGAVRHLRDADLAQVDNVHAAEIVAARSRVRVQLAEVKRLMGRHH